MINKHFELPESSLETIQMVKEKKGFKTQTQALIHIIEAYEHHLDKEEMRTEIYGELNQELREIFAGVVVNSRRAEKNMNTLMDLANSYLLLQKEEEIELVPTSVVKANFIKRSEEIHKREISQMLKKRRTAKLVGKR